MVVVAVYIPVRRCKLIPQKSDIWIVTLEKSQNKALTLLTFILLDLD